jgi:phosphoserine aminotransferase
MTKRIFNFSAGPATLPLPVLERAQAELTSVNGTGMSVMEISHRSETFEKILTSAKQGIRDLMDIPDSYEVLLMHGGASMQFDIVPMNFLPKDGSADYIITGTWGKKAASEAKVFGKVNAIYDSGAGGFRNVPLQEELRFDPNAKYIHYTSNETVDGVEFKYAIDGGNVPVVCDASSNILSKPFDLSKYALIYAGAQKNIGPSGVTLVIIHQGLVELVPHGLPCMMDYRNYVENGSMPNTPNTFTIYLIDLIFQWLKEKGGVAAIEKENAEKAKILYDALDASDGFYEGHAERTARSLMNVTFRLPSEELDDKFVLEAAKQGLDGLRGHRSVGGIRASIYNAFPKAGVERLVEFMQDFAGKN